MDNILRALQNIDLSKPEEEMILITDEPKIPGYLCFPKDNINLSTENSFGQGFDTDRTKARIKSIGECLERLCLDNPDEKDFVVGEYKDNKKFVDPSMFFCYSKEQVKNTKEAKEDIKKENYRWWKVKNLTTEEDCFIPAQMVFISKIFDDEMQIRRERISTGSALGKIKTNHALISGFMESVERDSCISAYLTKRKLKKITNLHEDLEKLVNYLQRYNLEPNIFDVTTDLNIPSVMVITLDNSGIGSAVNIGSRSSISYYDAIKYAIFESIHCRRTSRIIKEIKFPDKFPDKSEITCMDNRFFYWHPLERIPDLEFWLNENSSVDYSELSKKDISFAQALENVKCKKYNIFVADMTIPRMKNGGFEVLKIIIPELHPLYLDERAKSLYSIHHGSIKDNKELKPHPLT